MGPEQGLSETETFDQQRRLGINQLQELLVTTKHEPAGEELRTDFEKVYEQLAETADQIVDMYRATLRKYNLNPGEIRLNMVGGRVKGKPLKEESDIDLIFQTSNRSEDAETLQLTRFKNPLDAQDFRIDLKTEILQGIKTICLERGIPNLFHVLSFGQSIPEEPRIDSLEISRLGKDEEGSVG